MVDAHCHLQDIPNFDISSLNLVICAGASLESSRQAIEIAAKNKNVFATVGVHPESIINNQSSMIKELRELAKQPKVVAIGECGLDYSIEMSDSDRELQQRLLLEHVKLANDVNLPLVIHNRNANEDILKIINYKLKIKVMMHCFTGNENFMNECISRGWYISFGGILTFKKSEYLREIAKSVPDDKLLTETDSPYLSPEPYRKEINCPKNVKIIAQMLANLRGTSINQIEEIAEKNCRRLFNITPLNPPLNLRGGNP